MTYLWFKLTYMSLKLTYVLVKILYFCPQFHLFRILLRDQLSQLFNLSYVKVILALKLIELTKQLIVAVFCVWAFFFTDIKVALQLLFGLRYVLQLTFELGAVRRDILHLLSLALVLKLQLLDLIWHNGYLSFLALNLGLPLLTEVFVVFLHFHLLVQDHKCCL